MAGIATGVLLLFGYVNVLTAQEAPVKVIETQARQLMPLVESFFAREFLKSAESLPPLAEPRVVYYNTQTRDAYSESEAAGMSEEELEGYQRVELGEQFYYNTTFGTPLAAVRALDLAALAGFPEGESPKILDFGFGSIGQLRLLAGMGCQVTGLEVAPLLKAFYSEEVESGLEVPNADPERLSGNVRLLFGYYPSDEDIVDAAGDRYDLFISKNTLKKGYVNPEEEIDPRMGVDLGVGDEEFLEEVHRTLKSGGLFMIYNLSPAREGNGEPYRPQADGRSPFPRELFEKTDFRVLAFDTDDTPFAHRMAEVFGWDQQMNLETDLKGMYTLVQKVQEP